MPLNAGGITKIRCSVVLTTVTGNKAMKQLIMILMIGIGLPSVAFGQTNMSNDQKVEAQIIALEKAGWEAWKNRTPAWYQATTTDEVISINSGGVSNNTQMIKDLAACEVKSFALDNFKFVMLDKDAIMMTYTARQDGVCSGQKVPSQVRSTVNYVKRGGRWLEAMYMETPMSRESSAIQE
jgi:hypothetical protein